MKSPLTETPPSTDTGLPGNGRERLTGAESLVRTLVSSGVDVCFANPGTSEMHFVSALDREPGIRCVLGLFEGVVTGAADGYGRMLDRPAATMLHCGPGLANGLSQLHNGRRARTPILNVVGDQATYHRPLDAPLTADTEGWARPVSVWTRTSRTPETVGRDAAEAIRAARADHGVASLILPSDVCWSAGGQVAEPLADLPAPALCNQVLEQAARLLRGAEPVALVLGGRALREQPITVAHRIAATTGARLTSIQAVARVQRGGHRHAIDRIPYAGDQAREMLKGIRHVIVIGALDPVVSFAYPGKSGRPYPEDATVLVVARPEQDVMEALLRLEDALGAAGTPLPPPPPRIEAAPASAFHGPVTPDGVARALTMYLPEDAIVADESVSFGRTIYGLAAHAAPHDWLTLTGGAIGSALPLAVGAAVACPGRKVVALEGDGSAMYTLQSLWTMAREHLDIVVVIIANHRYAILQGELANVGAQAGPIAHSMLDIGNPRINWVSVSQGLGVEAARADDMTHFAQLFSRACRQAGPFLIELTA